MAKIYESPASAIEDVVFDGMSMAVGGFGLVGTPEYLLVAIHEKGTKDITVVANNAGAVGKALGLILEAGHIKKAIASYPGNHPEFVRQYFAGEIACDFTPQGTLAEKCVLVVQEFPHFSPPLG